MFRDLHLTLCRTVFGAAVLSAGCADAATSVVSASPVPTFSKDVAPILYAHCIRCHRGGEIAASQPLLSYDTVQPLARAIRQQVVARQMPPWPVDPKHSLALRNDARLEQKDIDTLVTWVDAGAPRGSAADLPAVPAASTGWSHPRGIKPDAVLRLPEVTLAASGEIPYVLQRIKVPLAKDKWIVAMQVRPGNNALVHHMGITEVSVADGVSPEDLDALTRVGREMGIAGDALANMQPAVADPVNPGTYDMLGVYTPGTTFEMYDHGSAKLLKSGANMYINFNIHYTTSGKPEKDRSELALWYQDEAPTHQLFRAPGAVGTIIANGRELLSDDPGTKAEGTDVAIPPIPPYASNYELIGIAAYTESMTLYQLQPHAHMRGKDFKYSVVYPDGREVIVLSVPQYDFHWQLAYDLQTPLALPAGSKLIVTAHYDNSPRNKHLTAPGVDQRNCGPDKQAYFRRQNQSWHEMFSPLIQYSMDRGRSGLRMVQAVGCLTRAPETSHAAAPAWALAAAGDPVTTAAPSTAASELHASGAARPGTHTYGLVGASLFMPQRHEGHRVAVKGVLIEDATGSRLNVTSLQPVAGVCRERHAAS